MEEQRETIEPFLSWKMIVGTTTDNYTDAMNWVTKAIANKSFLLKNTHAVNGLNYKLLTQMGLKIPRVDLDPIQDEKVGEEILAAGEVAEFLYNRAYTRMILQVRAEVAGSQATYQIDYLGEGI